MNITNKTFIFVLVPLFICGSIFAHSGRTDSNGGHNNRKTGGYHYHNSGYSSKSYNSVKKEVKNTIVLPNGTIQLMKIGFVQSGLSLLGYYNDTIDYKVGPNTRKAIRELQRKNGLSETGEMDPRTQKVFLKKLRSIDLL